MKATSARSVTVADVAKVFAGGTPSRNKVSYYGGDVPWVKSGEVANSPITSTEEMLTPEGFAKSSAKWCEVGSTLVAMYGATAGKIGWLAIRAATNQAVLCVSAVDPAHARFLYHALSAAAPNLMTRTQGSGQPNLNAAIVKSLRLPWPDALVRERVTRLFDILDKHTQAITRLADSKRVLKDRLMRDLLAGRRRILGFEGRVRQVSLGDHASEMSQRNSAGWGAERVMGVIKGVGLTPMREHVRAADLTRYKVVPPQGFAYNPMRLNIGSIARSHLVEECLVSPDYVVFRTKVETLLPAFLDHLRHSHIWSQFVRPAGSGSVRVRIYFRDLAELRIPLPTLPEQRRIAHLLGGLDCEIGLLNRLRDTRERQKAALLQRLVAGELNIPTADGSELTLIHA